MMEPWTFSRNDLIGLPRTAIRAKLPRLMNSASLLIATGTAVVPHHRKTIAPSGAREATDFKNRCSVSWSFAPGTGIGVQRSSKSTALVLTSPQTLNVLTLDTVRALRAAMDREEPGRLVLLHASGGRAMCAGANVWDLAKLGPVPMELPAPNLEFFRELFSYMSEVHKRKETWVACAHGPAVGSGMAMCVLGKHCVVTEDTFFCMPETTIGLTPSSGGSYFLSRLPNFIGEYMGLTGARALARDILDLGLATHYLPRDLHDEFVSSCHNYDTPSGFLAQIQPDHPLPTTTATWRAHIDAIRRCFSLDSVQSINKALTEEACGDGPHADWAHATIEEMEKVSPTALELSLECIRRGRHLSLDECLWMELRVTRAILAGNDFLEGTRVRFGDRKGQTPTFAPMPERQQVLKHFNLMPADKDLKI